MPYSYKLGRYLGDNEWEYMSVANYISERTFVIADPHFGDSMEHLLKYSAARRDLLAHAGLMSIDQIMIDRWNNAVGSNDVVLVLGDFTHEKVPNDAIPELTSKLKGKKVLIKGNHDKEDPRIYKACGWHEVISSPVICLNSFDYALRIDPGDINRPPHASCVVVKINQHWIMLSHLPIIHDATIDVLDNYPRTCCVLKTMFDDLGCKLNIHGHIHDHELEHPQCINASADKLAFTPVRIAALLKQH